MTAYIASRWWRDEDVSACIVGRRWGWGLVGSLLIVGALPLFEYLCRRPPWQHYAQNEVPIAALLLALTVAVVPPKRTIRFSATQRLVTGIDRWFLIPRLAFSVPFEEIERTILRFPPPERIAPLFRPALMLQVDQVDGPRYLASLRSALLVDESLWDLLAEMLPVGNHQAGADEATRRRSALPRGVRGRGPG